MHVFHLTFAYYLVNGQVYLLLKGGISIVYVIYFHFLNLGCYYSPGLNMKLALAIFLTIISSGIALPLRVRFFSPSPARISMNLKLTSTLQNQQGNQVLQDRQLAGFLAPDGHFLRDPRAPVLEVASLAEATTLVQGITTSLLEFARTDAQLAFATHLPTTKRESIMGRVGRWARRQLPADVITGVVGGLPSPLGSLLGGLIGGITGAIPGGIGAGGGSLTGGLPVVGNGGLSGLG
jgi:hypothetical protein